MKRKIEKLISKIIKEKIAIDISIPAEEKFGHYATAVAFGLAKARKGNPLEIAGELKNQLEKSAPGDFFEKIEVAPPGYLNFWLKPEVFQEALSEILKDENYGQGKKKKEKIIIEFISANPTGPLTMANGRGGFLGDILANILDFAGYKVFREYYVNDAGNQVKLLGESVLAELGLLEKKDEHYKGDYIKDLAILFKNRPEEIKKSNGRVVAEVLLEQIRQSIEQAGIKFDNWFSEFENLHQKKELEKTLKLLEKKKLVVKKEGALWLKSASSDEEKDRVLVKSDGAPTYFLADLAYHFDKFLNRKFAKAIDIWGADHHGYVTRLKDGVEALGIDKKKLEIIIVQLVRLVEGGREVRMSKRKGEFITLDELIKEVGLDAARFFFSMYSADTHMDFDIALAKERSLKNPVYYIQYAAVRCGSILEKSSDSLSEKAKLDLLNSKEDLQLIRELIKFPEVITEISENYQIHRLSRYALELARAFHNFYEKERVIDSDERITAARLALIRATLRIFKNLFSVLGISLPEKM